MRIARRGTQKMAPQTLTAQIAEARRRILGAAALSFAATLLVAPVGAQAPGVTAPAILNYTCPDRQRMLEEGAKREGELLLYTTGTQIAPLMSRFTQKYPFIKLKFFR